MNRSISLIAAALLATGCASQSSNDGQSASSQPAETTMKAETKKETTAKTEAPSAAVAMAGISEDAFVKLHKHTDAEAPALKGRMIEIDGDAAYLSLPQGKKPGEAPGIVMIHEWWGLNENVKHWADRLAADGYAVVAVDLYAKQVTKAPDEAMKMMKAIDSAKASKTLKNAFSYLASDAAIKAKKRGAIGWCFGGGWSLNFAIQEPSLDAAVMYYGFPVMDESLKKVKAPLLGIFGNQDEFITPAKVDAFEKALQASGVNATIIRKDANHAFANPSSAHYNQEHAAEAWKATRGFLAAELKHK